MLPEETAPLSPVAPTRAARLTRLFELLSPWGSLALSAYGALSMDRGEGEGAWVVLFAALSFAALTGLAFAHRPGPQPASEKGARLHALLRFGTLSGSQSLVQRSLLFSLPFYVQASAFTPAQCLFLAAFALAVAVSLWDPWSARALLHPLAGPALLAFASFAAWNAALPMLSVPHRAALWIAAGSVGVLVPGLLLLRHAGSPRRLQLALAGALVPAVLGLFGVQLLPAAPFKVVEMGIGTGVVGRGLVGAATHLPVGTHSLYCLSAVFEPRGLHDALVHVWYRDGVEWGRTHLAVRGGRKRGYRTWSRRDLAVPTPGTVRCAVLTELGQTLAVSEVELD